MLTRSDGFEAVDKFLRRDVSCVRGLCIKCYLLPVVYALLVVSEKGVVDLVLLRCLARCVVVAPALAEECSRGGNRTWNKHSTKSYQITKQMFKGKNLSIL